MNVNYWVLNRVFSPPRGTSFLAEKKFQGKPLGPRLLRVPVWNAKFNTHQHRLVHSSLFYIVKFSTPQLTQQPWVRPISCFILSTRFPLLLCFCLSTVEPDQEQAGQNTSGAETAQFVLEKLAHDLSIFPGDIVGSFPCWNRVLQSLNFQISIGLRMFFEKKRPRAHFMKTIIFNSLSFICWDEQGIRVELTKPQLTN